MVVVAMAGREASLFGELADASSRRRWYIPAAEPASHRPLTLPFQPEKRLEREMAFDGDTGMVSVPALGKMANVGTAIGRAAPCIA